MNCGVNEGAGTLGEGDLWFGQGDYVAVRYGNDDDPEIWYGPVVRAASMQGSKGQGYMKTTDKVCLLHESSAIMCSWLIKIVEGDSEAIAPGRKRKVPDSKVQNRIDQRLAFTLPQSSRVAVKEHVHMWQVLGKMDVTKVENEGEDVYLLNLEDEAFVNEHVAKLKSGEVMEAREMVKIGAKAWRRKGNMGG